MTTKTFLSTGEVARVLGVRETRVQDLVRQGAIAAPELIGGRRLWGPRDVERLREIIAERRAARATVGTSTRGRAQ